MTRRLIFTLLLSISLMPTLGLTEEESATAVVKVTNAWIAETPPTATVLAGYMQLENTSNQEIVLDGAQSQDFKEVAIHETVVKADKVSMVAHKTLSIPAGKTVSFEPGGFHLMLVGAKKPLKAGDTTEIVLHFQEGTTQSVKMEVKKRSTEQAIDHDHHH